MSFFLDLAKFIVDLLWWLIIVQVILSWLIAFNTINTTNPTVRQFLAALEKMTAPLYRPIRKVLPDFGGLDFSPVVILLVLSFLSAELGKWSFQASIPG
jgi:YggT family protein